MEVSGKIAVAIIHGVHQSDPGYADWFISAISFAFDRELYPLNVRSSESLVFRAIFWSGNLRSQQGLLLARSLDLAALRLIRWRKHFLEAAGDAVAYLSPDGPATEKAAIHMGLAKELRELANETGGTAPLCLVAHSLGTVIALNYIRELQGCFYRQPNHQNHQLKATACNSALERGDTLANIYTMGSPIAMCSPHEQSNSYPPVLFPAPRIGAYWPGANPRWRNYFYGADIIGMPLGFFGPEFASVFVDERLGDDFFLDKWNPLVHVKYWKDIALASKIGRSLAQFWREAYWKV